MNWKLMLAKKALMGAIPFNEKLRRIKRRIFGYSPNPDHVELTLNNYERMKSSWERAAGSIQGLTILEVGSGWFPVMPILLVRDGAKKVYMTDLNVHMDDITFRATADYLKKRFPEDQFIQGIRDFASLPIEYLAPFHSSVLPDKSLDVVMSHAVLEHIPRSDIYQVFSSLRPKVADDGFMIHMVDHSDHFEHVDKSISRIQFLTWGEEKHAVINYLIKDGENRLRHHEYHQVFNDAGFTVVDEEKHLHQETLEDIKKLDLVYPYSTMSPEQLAVLTSTYILKPAQQTADKGTPAENAEFAT